MVLLNIICDYMAKMLLDLSEEESKIVEVYKITNDFKTKQDAIKSMVRYFEIIVRPRNLKAGEYKIQTKEVERMPEYVCPKCGSTLFIGLEVSVGGEPKHNCSKCGTIMVRRN
jgi:rubrerythrin